VKKVLLYSLALVVGLVIAFAVEGAVRGHFYDKHETKYESDRQAWQVERTTLTTRAEEKEKHAAALEIENQVYKATAEKSKQVDQELAAKIETMAKEAADEQVRAQAPADCRVRAQRVCDLFRADDPKYDCRAFFAQCDRPR
jgi:hypothetical protein